MECPFISGRLSPAFPSEARAVSAGRSTRARGNCGSDLRNTACAAYAEAPASIGAAGRAKFESTELCSVYVDLHAIPALAIGNGS